MSQYYLYYIDSINKTHQLFFTSHSHRNLMEFISDTVFEEWGDCKGRAWCGTCMIKVNLKLKTAIDQEEKSKLLELVTTIDNERLACQIPLNKDLHKAEIRFIGDF